MLIHSNSKRTLGFTLVEMMIVIAITGMVGLAVTTMIQYFYQKNAYLLEQTSALANARSAMLSAIRALREASYGDDGSYPIASVATSTITFYADVDDDGAVEKIRYYLKSGTLYEGVTNATGTTPSYVSQPESTTTVATSVRNASSTPLFTYYDNTGATTTNVAQIAAVTVSVWVDINPNRAPNVFNLSETATFRNLRN